MTAPRPAGSVLDLVEFRALLGARLANRLAGSGLATVVAYQTYLVSRDPLALGLLGLVQVTPILAVTLFAGHVADRRDRRAIVMGTNLLMAICTVALALLSLDVGRFGLVGIFAVIFVTGIASGFYRPALTAFEAQVIPLGHAATGVSWAGSVSQVGAIVAPALAGFCWALVGPTTTYALLALAFAVAAVCIVPIARKPMPVPTAGEDLRHSLATGIRYVLRTQILVGAMALDLFAVFFGGAMAMLPIYASDILMVGPAGLGLLRTAPAVGSLLAMLALARRPPAAGAGAALLIGVVGFGLSMIVFAVSRDFFLSLAALFMSGFTDGICVVIRTVVVRIASPEHMRGRVGAVNFVFIAASNELGDFEAGVLARIMGVVPSVVFGGVLTLVVAGVVAVRAPLLRRLDLRNPAAATDDRLDTALAESGPADSAPP
jgi:MFS family permease